jgi:hypothetical protein
VEREALINLSPLKSKIAAWLVLNIGDAVQFTTFHNIEIARATGISFTINDHGGVAFND